MAEELQDSADITPPKRPTPPPGTLAPSIVTQAKVYKPESDNADEVLDSDLVSVIKSLVEACSEGDQAARRVSVLATWEARHFDRGYQFLDTDSSGGWKIVGADRAAKGNMQQDQDDANLYPTNIYSAQGDITIGALCRGAIKVNFAAKNKQPLNVQCADECNKYKFLWEKNNEANDLQRTLMGLAWTDCRGAFWTRSMVDKARYGTNDDGSLRVVETSTAHGVLETKCPMMADELCQMSYFQIFEDLDYALARAMFPWMGDRIKPSWGVFGQMEFERIARINTRIGMVAKNMTGTSGIRECTIGYTWLRPGMFFDDKVNSDQRDRLLEKFPDGVLAVLCGKDFVCGWNESMDDHIVLGMFTRGFGQNRRALGSSDLPLQKRTNIWVDLADKFLRAAIPFTMTDDQAFNQEAMAQQEASPSRFISVVVPDGRPITDLIAASPQISPQQMHMDMMQWVSGPLIQSIDGATPALFGMTDGEDTVGGTQIRLQQALERIGPPWLVANKMYARACGQAARCCAENNVGEMSDYIEGEGQVSVDPSNMKGDAECTPETTNGIPESSAQREAKIMQLLDMASTNPVVASAIARPANAKQIIDDLGMGDVISVVEADCVTWVLQDIEKLITQEPLMNPAYAQLEQQLQQETEAHEQAKQLATQFADELTPDQLDQGEQMEQGVAQLQQQLQATPQKIASIPVAEDETEDHATAADTCDAWSNTSDGYSLKRSKNPVDQEHWLNFSLYWAAHRDMRDKLASQQGVPPKTSITIAADKLSGTAQVQALEKAGIQIQTQDADTPHEQEVETIQRTPEAEIKTTTRART